MTFPRLYAQLGSDEPIELQRGIEITEDAEAFHRVNMGSGWRVWREHACLNPVGRNVRDGRAYTPRPTSDKALALTKEEMRELDQNDVPFAINAPIRMKGDAREVVPVVITVPEYIGVAKAQEVLP